MKTWYQNKVQTSPIFKKTMLVLVLVLPAVLVAGIGQGLGLVLSETWKGFKYGVRRLVRILSDIKSFYKSELFGE